MLNEISNKNIKQIDAAFVEKHLKAYLEELIKKIKENLENIHPSSNDQHLKRLSYETALMTLSAQLSNINHLVDTIMTDL
jgi:FKBP-type peptidyl-prolyl cis-trans isomerase (trigger factor)